MTSYYPKIKLAILRTIKETMAMSGINKLAFYFVGLTFSVCSFGCAAETPRVSMNPTTPEMQKSGYVGHYAEFINFPLNQDIHVRSSQGVKSDPNKFRTVGTLRIDSSGFATMNGSRIKSFFVDSGGAYPGLRYWLQFVSPDGQLLAETFYFPRPLQFKSKNQSFTLDAELMSTSPTVYKLDYIGLQPNEGCKMRSITQKETGEMNFTYSPQNAHLYEPTVAGVEGGEAMVIITRASGDQAQAKLPWGSAIAKEVENDWQVQKKRISKYNPK